MNDSRFFEPPDVIEPEFDQDGNEIQILNKEECRELLGEVIFERRRDK